MTPWPVTRLCINYFHCKKKLRAEAASSAQRWAQTWLFRGELVRTPSHYRIATVPSQQGYDLLSHVLGQVYSSFAVLSPMERASILTKKRLVIPVRLTTAATVDTFAEPTTELDRGHSSYPEAWKAPLASMESHHFVFKCLEKFKVKSRESNKLYPSP